MSVKKKEKGEWDGREYKGRDGGRVNRSIYIEKSLSDKMDKIMKETGRSFSNYVEALIRDHLAER